MKSVAEWATHYRQTLGYITENLVADVRSEVLEALAVPETDWVPLPGCGGLWAVYDVSDGSKHVYVIRAGELSGIAVQNHIKYRYIGNFPTLPVQPASDKEIADAARKFIANNFHGATRYHETKARLEELVKKGCKS